jgi:hypothetical protein
MRKTITRLEGKERLEFNLRFSFQERGGIQNLVILLTLRIGRMTSFERVGSIRHNIVKNV